MADILKPKTPPFAPTERQIEDRTKALYRDAWEDINKEIAKMYERYSRDGTLSMADMTRYNRLAKTEEELAGILSNLYKKNRKYLYQTIESASLFGYFNQAYKFEMHEQRRLGFGGFSREAVDAIFTQSLGGLVIDQRLGNNQRQAVADIRQGLAQGLVRGESYPVMARRLKSVLDSDYNRAVLVAWTETHRAEEAASFDTREKARSLGVDFKDAWLSTLDRRTRSTHRTMDGKTQGDDGYFTLPGGAKGRYPGDPLLPAKEVIRCRCTAIASFPDETLTGKRRGRSDYDDPNSKSELFPATMTYPQWYDSRILDKPVNIIQPKDIVTPSVAPTITATGNLSLIANANATREQYRNKNDYKTTKEASSFVSDLIGAPVDLGRADVRMANQLADAIEHLTAIMPNITKGVPVRKFSSNRVAGQATANLARRYGKSFRIIAESRFEVAFSSTIYLKNFDETAAMKKESKRQNWSVSNDPRATVYHEYGHILHYTMSRSFARKGRLELTGSPDIGRTIKERVVKRLEEANPGTTEVQRKLMVVADMSRYGNTKDQEYFAEAFTALMTEDKPAETIRLFGEELEALMKEAGL